LADVGKWRGALGAGQVLDRGDERELDALAQLVARVRGRRAVVELRAMRLDTALEVVVDCP
jgi:hypothetical protein